MSNSNKVVGSNEQLRLRGPITVEIRGREGFLIDSEGVCFGECSHFTDAEQLANSFNRMIFHEKHMAYLSENLYAEDKSSD